MILEVDQIEEGMVVVQGLTHEEVDHLEAVEVVPQWAVLGRKWVTPGTD